jgi:RsmE family RNA methyltransferase
MNLILLADDDFIAADRVRLSGRRLAYVRGVHRAAPGTVLRVGKLDGGIGSGTVIALGDDELVLDVVLDRAPPPPTTVTLLLALPRPKVLRRLLQCAAAAGVKRIVVFNTWRVEKSFWSSPALGDAAIREQLLLGLEQGGDTVLPVVEMRARFKPFVEDEVRALIAGTRALVAHPAAARPCPYALSEPTTVAIGPEGGFTAYELELLCRHGFEAVSLGPRPLRVEHAVPALLGRLWSAGACSRFGVGGEDG